MITATQIKEMTTGLRFDLCGIAPPARFSGAPQGHHPQDIYSQCKSVVVYAKQVPSESLFAINRVPYTMVNNTLIQEVDRLSLQFCLALEKMGISAVMVPSDDPYEYWDEEREYGRGILSLKHAGYLAGLGTLGKNTLLINREYGNMIQLGAVLVNIEIEPDPIADYEGCLPRCKLCLAACPQKALDGITIDQKLCRAFSNIRTEKGYLLKNCYTCRRVCPRLLGIGQEGQAVRKRRTLEQASRV